MQETELNQQSQRLVSLDAMRGLIMCLLACNGLALAKTARKLGYGPNVEVDSFVGQVWQFLSFHNSHPIWTSQFYYVGCSMWDLIQPAFMFMVGVAMPYSYAKRRQRGDSELNLTLHAAIRAFVLVAIGVYLQTRNSGLASNRLFTNVLSQIGLGYFFVFLLLGRSFKFQLAAGISVLLAYWYWLFQYPVLELTQAAVDSIASLHVNETVGQHFALTGNGAADVDVKLLNWLFETKEPIAAHKAGYTTLNFIPSAVTILIGVFAGSLLKSDRSATQKVTWLMLGGLIAMVLAVVASVTVCPVVKKIWTPSWVLFSGAWVLWILALLYWIVDIRGFKRWTFPLVVVGMNSLAMYLMGMLFKGTINANLKTYLGKNLGDNKADHSGFVEAMFLGPYAPTLQSIGVFIVLWLICFYLYRNKLFFRV